MRNILNKILCKPLIFLSLALAFLGACKDETGNIGLGILPNIDTLTTITFSDSVKVANTFLKDSIRVDEATNSLLGSVNDPVFGQTTMDIITQVRLNNYPEWTDESIPDSLVLYLRYTEAFGDTTTEQTIKVYELQNPIDIDEDYYSNEDFSSLKGELLGDYKLILQPFEKTSGGDSTITMAIKLDKTSLLYNLFNADTVNYLNADNFLNFFYGLYIETEQVTTEGNYAEIIIDNEQLSGYSNMILHYHDTTIVNDTTITETNKTLYFNINQFAARINHFRHDYSNAVFYPEIEQGYEDTLLYLQPTGGTYVELSIPDFEEINEDQNLIFSGDTLNAVLSKTELIFPVDTVATDYQNYPLPSRIILTYIDENGENVLPIDYAISDSYYSGYLNSNYEYRFNITNHFEQLINEEIDVQHYVLTTAEKNSSGLRVVLKGPGSSNPVRLEISYSKL